MERLIFDVPERAVSQFIPSRKDGLDVFGGGEYNDAEISYDGKALWIRFFRHFSG